MGHWVCLWHKMRSPAQCYHLTGDWCGCAACLQGGWETQGAQPLKPDVHSSTLGRSTSMSPPHIHWAFNTDHKTQTSVCNVLSDHQSLWICITCNSGASVFLLILLWQLALISFVKCDIVVVRQAHHELDKLWEDALCHAAVFNRNLTAAVQWCTDYTALIPQILQNSSGEKTHRLFLSLYKLLYLQ